MGERILKSVFLVCDSDKASKSFHLGLTFPSLYSSLISVMFHLVSPSPQPQSSSGPGSSAAAGAWRRSWCLEGDQTTAQHSLVQSQHRPQQQTHRPVPADSPEVKRAESGQSLLQPQWKDILLLCPPAGPGMSHRILLRNQQRRVFAC